MNEITRKMVAIGGGDDTPGCFPSEGVSAYDEEIIKLSGKKNPKLLFVPTATKDWDGYITAIQAYFGTRLECQIDVLYAFKRSPSQVELRDKILMADIIYVGGGNTLYMMKRWKMLGIDKLLRQAYDQGTVMSGLSAGAICWFKYGTSDSRIITDPTFKEYIRVSGMGWFNLTMSPHHLTEKKRKPAITRMIGKYGGVGLALDDYAAIEILDDKFKIITTKPIARAHKVYKEKRKVIYEEIPTDTELALEYLTSVNK